MKIDLAKMETIKTPLGDTILVPEAFSGSALLLFPGGTTQEVDFYSPNLYDGPSNYAYSDDKIPSVSSEAYVFTADNYLPGHQRVFRLVRPALNMVLHAMETDFPDGQTMIPAYKVFFRVSSRLGYKSPTGAWNAVRKLLWDPELNASRVLSIPTAQALFFLTRKKGGRWGNKSPLFYLHKVPDPYFLFG